MNIPSLSFNVIGRFRSELMGIAILNVLVLHSLSWTQLQHPSWLVTVLNTFGRLVFTEGFLFLSGFGLYYSFRKNNNLAQFYTKRVKRLLVPYWLMTLPFFVFWMLLGKFDIVGFLTRLTTIEFWISGNYSGMWYVALSVLLYACLPLIYLVIYRRGG